MNLCHRCGESPLSLVTGSLEMCLPCGQTLWHSGFKNIPSMTQPDSGLRGYAEHAATDHYVWWQDVNKNSRKLEGDL